MKAMQNLPGKKYITKPYALLNIGNLRKICKNGQDYDAATN